MFLKAGLSLGLIYHLATVLLLPNADSLIGRAVVPHLLTYANLLGVNAVWQFFSPSPLPGFFIEFEIDREGSENAIPETYVFPPEKAAFSWNEGYNRRWNSLRFFGASTDRFQSYFIPFLCSFEEKATAVTVQTIVETVPEIHRTWSGERFDTLAERISSHSRMYDCPRADGREDSEEGSEEDSGKGLGEGAGDEAMEAEL